MPTSERPQEVADDARIWFEPGDVAELTWETGEVIRALWTRPRGTHAGWVLTDGTRLRARPRGLVHIEVIYPPDHHASEDVHHDEHPDTDPATDAEPEHLDRRAGESASSATG